MNKHLFGQYALADIHNWSVHVSLLSVSTYGYQTVLAAHITNLFHYLSATLFSSIAVLWTVCPCLDTSNIYLPTLPSLQILKISLLIKSNILFEFVSFECNAIFNLPCVCSLQLVNKSVLAIFFYQLLRFTNPMPPALYSSAILYLTHTRDFLRYLDEINKLNSLPKNAIVGNNRCNSIIYKYIEN